jgi:hypothetical protein
MGHIQGEFEAKWERMKKYLAKIQGMQTSFQKLCITKIPREDNEKANRLARMASAENTDSEENMEQIRSLKHSSIFDEASEVTLIKDVSD